MQSNRGKPPSANTLKRRLRQSQMDILGKHSSVLPMGFPRKPGRQNLAMGEPAAQVVNSE